MNTEITSIEEDQQYIRKLDNLVSALLSAKEQIGKEDLTNKYYLGFYNAVEFLVAVYEMREPELK